MDDDFVVDAQGSEIGFQTFITNNAGTGKFDINFDAAKIGTKVTIPASFRCDIRDDVKAGAQAVVGVTDLAYGDKITDTSVIKTRCLEANTIPVDTFQPEFPFPRAAEFFMYQTLTL